MSVLCRFFNLFGRFILQHLNSAFHMFRKRSLRDPTPFCSSRIAFLDQSWVNMWWYDYKQFNIKPKNFLFGETYIDVMNGRYPTEAVTNKRWVADVDHLYFGHCIENNHWVAVDANLIRRHIDVYDCIDTAYSDTKIYEQILPYARMIPYIIKAGTTETKTRVSLQKFTINRRRGIPQNDQSGDCGVYTVKFLEHLALGISFEGLSDRNISLIRLKLAVEIFDEVPESYTEMSDPLPRGNQSDRLVLDTASQK